MVTGGHGYHVRMVVAGHIFHEQPLLCIFSLLYNFQLFFIRKNSGCTNPSSKD